MRLTNLVGSLAFGAALLASSLASAQGRGGDRNRLPLNYIDQPLTLPGGVLEPQLEFQAVHNPAPDLAPTAPAKDSYTYNMNVGVAIGLTRHFEIQSTFLPMELGPNQQYGSPSFQATYAWGNRRVDLGIRGKLTLNTVPVVKYTTTNGTTVKETGIEVESSTLELGMPLVFHHRHRVRLDTGAFLDFTMGRQVTTQNPDGTQTKTEGVITGLNIPFDLSFAAAKNVYFGGGTGFKIDDFNQAGASFAMPLKLYGGFSWGTRKHPYFTVVPYFEWDHLITPGQSAPETTTGAPAATADTRVQPTTATTAGPQETFHWDAWQFGLQFKGYLHMM